MTKQGKILFTGGSGLLGTEIRKLWPKSLYPSSRIFDVTDSRKMLAYLKRQKPQIIVHAAAFTSPPEVEKHPVAALEVNIIGTANVARLCLEQGLKMVYICTDYVFKGDRGNYKEDDPVLPVNRYAWSKLGGECAVRLLNDYLIVRTSFGERVFPYEKAFIDHYTSRESVEIIAKKIVKAVNAGVSGVLHLGHRRRSVYEYAKALDPRKAIGKISIKQVKFAVPRDTSLNVGKYKKLIGS